MTVTQQAVSTNPPASSSGSVMDPVPPENVTPQWQSDLSQYNDLNATDRYRYFSSLASNRRSNLYDNMTPANQQWLSRQGYRADDLSGGDSNTMHNPLGTGGSSGSDGGGTASGDSNIALTPELANDFRGMSFDEQQSYLSNLSPDQYDDLYGKMTPTAKDWFDAQGFTATPSGDGSSGSGDAAGTATDAYAPNAYVDTNQRGAQDL